MSFEMVLTCTQKAEVDPYNVLKGYKCEGLGERGDWKDLEWSGEAGHMRMWW